MIMSSAPSTFIKDSNKGDVAYHVAIGMALGRRNDLMEHRTGHGVTARMVCRGHILYRVIPGNQEACHARCARDNIPPNGP